MKVMEKYLKVKLISSFYRLQLYGSVNKTHSFNIQE